MSYRLTKTRVRLAGGAAILALSASAAMAQEGVEQRSRTLAGSR